MRLRGEKTDFNLCCYTFGDRKQILKNLPSNLSKDISSNWGWEFNVKYHEVKLKVSFFSTIIYFTLFYFVQFKLTLSDRWSLKLYVKTNIFQLET